MSTKRGESITLRKTAVYIDGCLLKEADRAARDMGLSRSRLFSMALGDFLRHRRHQEVLEQLNHVYRNEPRAKQRAMAAKLKAKLRTVI